MATQPRPFERQNLKNLATMLVETAIRINDGVGADKPNAAEAAKNLKSLKLLLGLVDYEIKELRRQK